MPRIIITEPDIKPQPYRLEVNRIVTKIGRAKDNDILITDGSASSHHCKIKRVEGGFILVDSESTNGIKYEDTRYSIIDLKDGQTVQIGDHIDLEFTLSEEEIEELSSEDFESQQKASFPKRKTTQEKPEEQVTDDDEKSSESSKQQGRSKDKKRLEQDDDDVDLEEAKPKRKKASRSEPSSSHTRNKAPRNTQVKQANAGLSFIIFMILAVLCFLAGLAVRHYQDHGSFIFTT